MGELVRRLDYEYRSKGLMKYTVRGQRINKEYSTPVRSANAMADRQLNLQIAQSQMHVKMFMDRHDYEIKELTKFRWNLDTKSQKFDNAKFQKIRSRSAQGRLQSKAAESRGRSSKSDIRNLHIDPVDGIENLEEPPLPINVVNYNALKDLSSAGNPVLKMKRSASYGGTSLAGMVTRYKPSMKGRRQSMPARLQASIQPRAETSLSRRESRITARFTDTLDDEEDDDERGIMSYRILRDAFQKKRHEEPDPRIKMLDSRRRESKARHAHLNERAMKKFNDIFADMTTNIY